MREICAILLPANRAQNHFFRRFRNLTTTFTAYVFGMKHDIHKSASVLQTTSGLLHRLIMTWTLVYKRFQFGREFSPTLLKFSISLNCHALQTETSKRNSTKLRQTVDGKSRKQYVVENLVLSLPKKMEAKKLLHLFGFRQLRDLMSNICWTKRDIKYRPREGVEEYEGSPIHCPQISWTLVHKWLKTGPDFLPTLTILFCPSPSHALYAAQTWRPTATLNEAALGLSAAQIRSPRKERIVVGGRILFSPSNLRARWTELGQTRPHARK